MKTPSEPSQVEEHNTEIDPNAEPEYSSGVGPMLWLLIPFAAAMLYGALS